MSLSSNRDVYKRQAAELLCQDGGQYTHMILAGGENCFFEVDEEKLLGQLRAVSYTHLDVYKRQK